MAAGRWNTNGQGVIFSPDGDLLDGQHRLRAVVEAGVTVEMFVVRGVPKERFETMDTGRARTVGDVLGAQSYTNANNLAAIARLAWNYVAGASINYGPSKSALVAFVHANPFLQDITNKVVGARAPLPASPLGSILFLGNAGSQSLLSEAEAFLEGIRTGENLKHGDARLTLREWFYAERARDRGTVGADSAFAAIARSWNAFARGDDLKIIKKISNPNRANLPIFGFSPEHFSGVEDVAARKVAVAEANLSLVHRANAARKTG